MMGKKTDILAMDCLCADVFDATGEIRPGGEALNFAAVASEYDTASVSLLGAIGDDKYGEEILRSIDRKRIDKKFIHIIKNGATATHRIYLTEGGDRYFKPDSWRGGVHDTFRLDDGDRARILRADAVFITYDSPVFDDVLALKRRGGFRLAVDFNVFCDFAALEPILNYIDFFMISGEEGLLPQFAELSARFGGIFNVTLAEKGSVSFLHGVGHRVKAVPVDEVIDTTGCGDSYHAAFLCSYLAGSGLVQAMNEGSRAAAKTLGHVGGVG